MLKNRSLVFISDLLALLIAFSVTQVLYYQGRFDLLLSRTSLLRLMFLYVAYFLVFTAYVVKTPVFKRDFLKNLKTTFILWVWMTLILCFLLYALRLEPGVNRIYLCVLMLLSFVCMFIGREFVSHISRHFYEKLEHKKRVVLFANDANVMKALQKISKAHLIDYDVVGIVIYREGTDRVSSYYRVDHYKNNRLYGKTYLEDGRGDVLNFLKKEAIDEALLSLPETDSERIRDLVLLLESMGIDSSVTMNSFSLGLEASGINRFGPYHVLTFSPRVFNKQELLMKRMMGIAGGLVGCVLCVIIGLFVGPAIYFEDPGPIIFKQKRVGRNGRIFEIYKFRSMYQDAEERKKELMKQNEMNGLMFKMKNDPRITKVGKFIRKTSLDEFPQFFNVLKGDMSLVGTRPPTVAEFEQYSAHHKRRLSLKPGITGLWQVSGRSDITDFEDVVKLDIEYIDTWSFWKDIRILFLTVWVVLTGKGSE